MQSCFVPSAEGTNSSFSLQRNNYPPSSKKMDKKDFTPSSSKIFIFEFEIIVQMRCVLSQKRCFSPNGRSNTKLRRRWDSAATRNKETGASEQELSPPLSSNKERNRLRNNKICNSTARQTSQMGKLYPALNQHIAGCRQRICTL